jgi:hypothetical protein
MSKPLKYCAELERLSDECSAVFSRYLAIRDEFAMTRKNDPSYSEKSKDLRKIQGQHSEAHKKFQQHIKDHSCR